MMRSNVVAKAPARFIRVSTEELHRFTPAILGSTGVLVVILVAINPGGIVPKSYVCVPWSSDQQELPLNFAIKSALIWILVNMVLFIITFFFGFIRKIWTFWTWDRTYFTALPNGAIIMPADRWTTDALYRAVDLLRGRIRW